jgi:hypothetical protein
MNESMLSLIPIILMIGAGIFKALAVKQANIIAYTLRNQSSFSGLEKRRLFSKQQFLRKNIIVGFPPYFNDVKKYCILNSKEDVGLKKNCSKFLRFYRLSILCVAILILIVLIPFTANLIKGKL